MTGLTEFQRMQLDAHHASNRATELGLTAQDIRNMPWDEYNRLFSTTRRQTPAEAALAAIDAYYEARHPTQATHPQDGPQSAPAAPEPQGIDPKDMSMEQYAQLRAQLGLDKAGQDQGIFGSGRATADAARFQAGRTAMSNAFVQEPPRIERAFVQQDAPATGRTGYYRGA
jgi:hypothetical protein